MSNPIQRWACKHGVSSSAYHELVGILVAPSQPLTLSKVTPQSEAAVQQKTTLRGSQLGGVLWRNNVGVAEGPDGRPIRFGVANLSKRMSEQVKSSDLIGITPVMITPDMVGRCVGVFTALECKHGGWRWGEDKGREVPQSAYHNIVRSMGGIAGFVSEPGQLAELIAAWHVGGA